jgi:hypothetical protein
MATLLDKKLSTYIITPHGMTQRGDDNTTTVPSNCHIFAMGVHEMTYFANPNGFPVDDSFQGIRNLWQLTDESKHSINDVLDTLIPSTGITPDARSKFAYYPPGCLIRNLRLERDRGVYTDNIDGIFKLGAKRPCALIGRGSHDYPKAYDFGRPLYTGSFEFNQTKDAYNFIKKHENKNEQKIIIVLACAGEDELGYNGLATGEGKLVENSIDRSIYDSTIKPSEIKFIKFSDDLKKKINFILEHNLAYNEKSHIGIDIPIRCIPKKDGSAINELCFKFRSKRAFNTLLTRIEPIIYSKEGTNGKITPTHLVIKDGIIIPTIKSDIVKYDTEYTLPYTLVKIPKDFNSYLYSPTYNMIQFFNNYTDKDIDTPFTTPPQSPSKLLPSGILGGYYYNKYLKYKNKYLAIKKN